MQTMMFAGDCHREKESRWSEVVPPRSALTFAAIWDPVDGMVTFSGARLFDAEVSDDALSASPRDAFDGQSQTLTIDALALALGSSVPSSAAFMIEEHDRVVRAPYTFVRDALDGTNAGLLHPTWRRTPPASDMCTFDPRHRFVAGRRAAKPPAKRSPLRAVLNQLSPKPDLPELGECPTPTSEVTKDERCCEGRRFMTLRHTSGMQVELPLKSAFSVSTTSTSEYVAVDFPSRTPSECNHNGDTTTLNQSSLWSTLNDVNRECCCPNSPFAYRRRLRKISRPEGPARPAEVLSRTHYNHIHPGRPCSRCCDVSSITRAKALLDRLAKCKGARNVEEEGWVCVELTHKVTQHVLS